MNTPDYAQCLLFTCICRVIRLYFLYIIVINLQTRSVPYCITLTMQNNPNIYVINMQTVNNNTRICGIVSSAINPQITHLINWNLTGNFFRSFYHWDTRIIGMHVASNIKGLGICTFRATKLTMIIIIIIIISIQNKGKA